MMNNLGVKGDHVFLKVHNFCINSTLMVDTFHEFMYGIISAHLKNFYRSFLKCFRPQEEDQEAEVIRHE